MSDNKFIDGLIVKAPHEKAPDFVKGSISIKRENLITWLADQKGDWINADIKVSKEGKWYVAVNDWKPAAAPEPSQPDSSQFDGFDDSDAPF